ncbi:MAG: 50S ribosomal protein L30 [Calditrichaeota bacterium]|nr:50S ribosomal protein L30 [Calditrichota bacterium]TDI82871.1 MAG: 50S ribosomal protein L30 [Caldithrix sp.]
MAKVKKIKITQVRSAIGRIGKQKKTLQALGLRRINHSVVHNETPQITGMINKVNHLVVTESA